MNCKKCNYPLLDEWSFCPICSKPVVETRKTKNRPNGSGSVYKLKNGKYQANVVLGYDIVDGKLNAKRKTKCFATKKEALEYLPMLRQSYTEIKKDIKLKDIYKEWYELHRQKVGKSTMDCYKSAFSHLKDIYYMNMNEIKTAHIQKCIEECPNGKRTKQNIKTLCSLLYKYAMQNDICEKNYAEFLYCGNDEQKTREPFIQKEIDIMFSLIDKIPDLVYPLCLIYTGLRLSEFINIKKQNFNVEEQYIIGGAKTEAGKDRIITISPKILPYCLKFYTLNNNEYLFTHNNRKIGKRQFYGYYYEALEKAGVRKLSPHSCRHTFATLMKQVEAPNTDKQKLIGHSSFEMTSHYTHTDLDSLKNITEKL